jgi:hypothetical protein
VSGVYVANSDVAGWRLLGWFLPIVGALVAFRYWTMRVVVGPDGLTVVQFPIRRFIPWADVSGIEVGAGNNIAGSSRCIHLVTRDGQRVKSHSVQRSRDDSPDLVAALGALRAALAEHRD